MRATQLEPGFIVTHQRVQRRSKAILRMALGAIIDVLHQKLSLMMVRMAIGAFAMREFQHPSTGGLGIRFMAILALHERMFSTQLEVGEIMIELLLAHFVPSGRRMA
jgi:hypothetical protein